MIRWSDNAATDYVLRLVGGPLAVRRTARAAWLALSRPIRLCVWNVPVLGRVPRILGAGESAGTVSTGSPTSRDDVAWERTPCAASRPHTTGTPCSQAWRGTPREWALVLAALYQETGTTSPAGRIIDQSLEWPLTEFPSNRSRFERFGTKGGSLPGVVTEASFFRPVGGKPLAVALFLRCVPRGLQDELLTSYAHQAFMQRLADDPEFLAHVRSALS